ncbi:PatA/PatG family cyanobactin maturation protease [Nonomuraea wenchangensis]|uniref:PatA/PatG family cyanobactin maturation protease n=1 Tax=Nonomuraea wenchangensis TaxID=568860 RepID=UPI0037138E93
MLDGFVEHGHPALTGARFRQLNDAWPGGPTSGQAAEHGTAVASVLFGRHDGPVPGMAPSCRAISVPVFAEGRRTSQLELARAIELATDEGAHIINISGGQLLAEAGEAEDVLARAVRRCHEQNILIVAAAGNDGCMCDHVPAALDGVLAVGACDEHGRALEVSNHGPGTVRQGLLALGQDVLVAVLGGGTARMSGTSFAAPIVSGVAALLLSLALHQGRKVDPLAVGELLLSTAAPCPLPAEQQEGCVRYLTGTLNITKAVTAMTSTSSSPDLQPAVAPVGQPAPPLAAIFGPADGAGLVPACATRSGPVTGDAGDPGGCGCSSGHSSAAPAGAVGVPAAAAPAMAMPAPAWGWYDGGGVQAASARPAGWNAAGAGVFTQDVGHGVGHGVGQSASGPVTASAEENKPATQRLVYALGTLGYDFGTEARRDTFKQLMPGADVDGVQVPANPYDPRQMVSYLRDNPSEARPLIWTLNLDLTPIYAIEPVGGYGPGVYERLVEFLNQQLLATDDIGFVDRISVPGRLPGRTVRLFNGQHVPVIEVNLTRGLYGWSVASLAHAVVAECDVPAHNQAGAHPEQERLSAAVADFLQRIYYDLRNFGATSRDRALNYAATNAVQARQTLAEALGKGMALKDIETEKSPYGRPDSDCWDVKLRFFDPENGKRAKRVYRFTIDVKDVLPVTLGPVRSWPEA